MEITSLEETVYLLNITNNSLEKTNDRLINLINRIYFDGEQKSPIDSENKKETSLNILTKLNWVAGDIEENTRSLNYKLDFLEKLLFKPEEVLIQARIKTSSE